MQPNRQQVSYAVGPARGLAITQLAQGVLSIICGIVVMVLYRWGIWVFTGAIEVWCPIPFVIAGILGILAAGQCSHGMIVAHMVLSIVSSVTAFILFIDSCIYARLLGPHIPLAIMAFAEFVISIISAALCCRAICCGRTNAQGGVVLGQPAPAGTVVVTTTAPGAMIYPPQQGVAYQPVQQYGPGPTAPQYAPAQPYGQAPAQPYGQAPAQPYGQPIETKQGQPPPYV